MMVETSKFGISEIPGLIILRGELLVSGRVHTKKHIEGIHLYPTWPPIFSISPTPYCLLMAEILWRNSPSWGNGRLSLWSYKVFVIHRNGACPWDFWSHQQYHQHLRMPRQCLPRHLWHYPSFALLRTPHAVLGSHWDNCACSFPKCKKKDGDEDRRRWKLMRLAVFEFSSLFEKLLEMKNGNGLKWRFCFWRRKATLEVLFFFVVLELEDIWNLLFNHRFSSVQSIVHIIIYTWWTMITLWHAKSV